MYLRHMVSNEIGRLLREFAAGVLDASQGALLSGKAESSDPLKPVPVEDMLPLIAALLAAETDVPMSWRAGTYMAMRADELLTARIVGASSLGDALDVIQRNHLLIANFVSLTVTTDARRGRHVCYRLDGAPDAARLFLVETVLAMVLMLLAEYGTCFRSWRDVDPRVGGFDHLVARLDASTAGISLRYQAGEMTYYFPPSVVRARVRPHHDRILRAMDAELARRASILPVGTRLRDLVKDYIGSVVFHSPSRDDVSRRFGLSWRTFSRILREQGTSYSNIIAEVRREKAVDFLKTSDKPLKVIAAELGFRSDASFNMAFKSWTGMTPMAYRKAG